MRTLLLIAGLIVASHAAAETPIGTARSALKALGLDVRVDAAQESAIPGFYDVVAGGKVVFVSKDGRYVLNGNAYDLPNQRDVGETSRARMRLAAVNALGDDKKIIFAPDNPRHSVTVFTDIDCPFCRRFHDQVAAFNAQGITVNYVFYPLDIHPGADKKAEAVWCAKDRKSAFTAAMSGHEVTPAKCSNPIAETTQVAQSTGVIGTPTILADDGTQVAAEIAMVPEKLAAELDRRAALAKARN
ncbi:MAG: DsbC family protein [Dokdonella sp.]